LQGIVPNVSDDHGYGSVLRRPLEPPGNDELFQFSGKSLTFGT
jgi:hypothetical protein